MGRWYVVRAMNRSSQRLLGALASPVAGAGGQSSGGAEGATHAASRSGVGATQSCRADRVADVALADGAASVGCLERCQPGPRGDAELGCEGACPGAAAAEQRGRAVAPSPRRLSYGRAGLGARDRTACGHTPVARVAGVTRQVRPASSEPRLGCGCEDAHRCATSRASADSPDCKARRAADLCVAPSLPRHLPRRRAELGLRCARHGRARGAAPRGAARYNRRAACAHKRRGARRCVTP